MPRNTELRHKRDMYIHSRFRYHRKRNPKWTIVAVIEAVAEEVFLSEITVVKILKQSEENNVPAPATMSKYNKQKIAEAAQIALF